MSSCNLATSSSCSATSIGSAGQLFTTLIQTILTAQCGYANEWPEDYGETVKKHGMIYFFYYYLFDFLLQFLFINSAAVITMMSFFNIDFHFFEKKIIFY